MHTVALAAGQLADFLLLIGALEIERRAIAARIHFALAEHELVEAAGNLLPNSLLAVERVARLIDIAKMHRLADLDRAFVGLLLLGDHAEQSGLAGAIRADDADNAASRQLEGEIVDQQIVAEALGEVGEVDDILAEPLGDRNDDLRGLRLPLAGLLEQLVVTLVTGLGFRLPRPR